MKIILKNSSAEILLVVLFSSTKDLIKELPTIKVLSIADRNWVLQISVQQQIKVIPAKA